MNIPPGQLEIVAAIVEEGGLTEGARRLGKSQPSVSRSLAQLKSRVGSALFEPGRRPLKPTELGRLLARQGQRIAEARRTAAVTVERFRGGHEGTVRLGGTPIFMDGVVSGLIAEFQRERPGVRIDQLYAYPSRLIAMLESEALDLAICPMSPEAMPQSLTFVRLLEGSNVVACRRGHPLTRRRIVSAADLAEYPWIAPNEESPLYRDLRAALRGFGVSDIRVGFSGGTLASVASILAGSDSLTILPYSVVFCHGGGRVLDAVSLKIDHPERHLGVLCRRGAPMTPAPARLMDFIADQFGSLARAIESRQRERLWRDPHGPV